MARIILIFALFISQQEAVIGLALNSANLWSRNTQDYVRLKITDGCKDEDAVRIAFVQNPKREIKVRVREESISCMRCALSGEGLASADALVDRDGGIYDKMTPYVKSRGPIYEAVKFGGRGKPYELLLNALTKEFGELREAIIEDAWPATDAIRLEGFVRFDGGAQVECFLDEALGLALASSCPLAMPRDLFELFSASEISEAKEATSDNRNIESIKNPAEYLALTDDDKVDFLLAAQVPPDALPRPRTLKEEPDALDVLLLPFVDEIVRREVLIEKAVRAGDIQTAARLAAEKSDRHRAYDAATEASDWGDLAAEAKARDDLALLEAARADPTQDPGSYSSFLDRDPWYEEQLRRNRERNSST